METTDVYPNPGGNTLNIRTALQNSHVEVYDINGRLIHSQALTENVTAIDAMDWPLGVYVWKVYKASVSTGSTTLAETGKWVKK
ncbi:MAG: T9SS type A sorting domain-containing protein [Bacteroidales bacterium]|nr:T9SS type A sorting domain-containing protein [Bacteroidales bacterium]